MGNRVFKITQFAHLLVGGRKVKMEEIIQYFKSLRASKTDDLREPILNLEHIDKFIKTLEKAQPTNRVQQNVRHLSSCAIYNEPAHPKGQCDCGWENELRKALIKAVEIIKRLWGETVFAVNYKNDPEMKLIREMLGDKPPDA